ncbi:hypothetical protein BDK89_0481 [Ilumatobacter fluminis]|uniref:Uncharacterized protein n=1 Tax=Ilumatobacter fluminis TaxID=467091 RepID=A0A4R7HVF1_9ACTN|nr:hypothetical protein BDK89_0481 [Ilumatobacter fluminis]
MEGHVGESDVEVSFAALSLLHVVEPAAKRSDQWANLLLTVDHVSKGDALEMAT